MQIYSPVFIGVVSALQVSKFRFFTKERKMGNKKVAILTTYY